MKVIRDNHVTNIAAYQLIQLFNLKFFNPDHYASHKTSAMLLDYEANRAEANFISEDVMDFCLKSDVYKTLGLTYVDIMHYFDMADYARLKEQLDRYNKEREAISDRMRREAEMKERDMLGGRNGRR